MNKFSKPLAYDVFISCGDVFKPKFPAYLDHALYNRGFNTCINHREAIENCKIFIVILSPDYVFRLDDFSKIMDECDKGNGRRILPVFSDLSPSNLQDKESSFGKALASVCNNFLIPDSQRFQKWTEIICQVSHVYGWHIGATGIYQHQYIDKIIHEVSKHVACSIGLSPRVEKFMSYLNSSRPDDDDGDCVVGIYGVTGIGKTTLARRVCHLVGGIEFDCCFFFDKVGKYSSIHGLLNLQRMLLSKIVGDNSTVYESVNEEGMSTINHMLNQKKVFLILEGIHDSEVLEAIIKLTTSFGSGSKVIITAREKDFLERNGIKRIYEVERLDKIEAMQLLCLKAFNSKSFKFSYKSILEQAETYASGHPIILEAIGSLFNGKDEEECESALEQYKMIFKLQDLKDTLPVLK